LSLHGLFSRILFPAIILGVILDFVVKAVFAIPVCVAFGAGVVTIAMLLCLPTWFP
jgi:hypothetical protein